MRANDDLQTIRILGIAGSLRKGSYNKSLLRTAQEEAPEGMTIDIFEIGEIPFFNQDIEDQGDPEPVQKLKESITQADAVLIVTPEYQHGLPGVLKNTLDWASRPPGKSPLKGKVVGMMGASTSQVGTARAHLQLRQTLMYNQCRIVARPEVLVANAKEKFEDGRLTDDKGREFIRKHLNAIRDEVHSRIEKKKHPE
jgi:chromate reductase